MSNSNNDNLFDLARDIVAPGRDEIERTREIADQIMWDAENNADDGEAWYHHQEIQRERQDIELSALLKSKLDDEAKHYLVNPKDPNMLPFREPQWFHGSNPSGAIITEALSQLSFDSWEIFISALCGQNTEKTGNILRDAVLDYLRETEEDYLIETGTK